MEQVVADVEQRGGGGGSQIDVIVLVFQVDEGRSLACNITIVVCYVTTIVVVCYVTVIIVVCYVTAVIFSAKDAR